MQDNITYISISTVVISLSVHVLKYATSTTTCFKSFHVGSLHYIIRASVVRSAYSLQFLNSYKEGR